MASKKFSYTRKPSKCVDGILTGEVQQVIPNTHLSRTKKAFKKTNARRLSRLDLISGRCSRDIDRRFVVRLIATRLPSTASWLVFRLTPNPALALRCEASGLSQFIWLLKISRLISEGVLNAPDAPISNFPHQQQRLASPLGAHKQIEESFNCPARRYGVRSAGLAGARRSFKGLAAAAPHKDTVALAFERETQPEFAVGCGHDLC